MKATDFFKSHQISYSEPIKSIFQDSRENQWILTENGLYRLTRNGNEEKLSSYFVAPPEKDKQPFYDALENNHTIYFTSKQGCVYEYNPARLLKPSDNSKRTSYSLAQPATGSLCMNKVPETIVTIIPGIILH